MNIKFFVSDTWACGHVRGEIIARYINAETVHQMVCKSDVLYSDLFKTDLMVFQRQCNPSLLPYLEEAKRRGIKTVCELDDDLFSLPPESEKAYKFYGRPEVQAGIQSFMQSCDAVTVSTGHLAEQTRPRTDRPIFIVENGVDFYYWDQAYAAHLAKGGEEVTIGWMASGTHSIDAVLLEKALPPLMDKYPNLRLHLIGWVETEHFGPEMAKHEDRIRKDKWTDISELPMLMSDFDIGLAPLVDNLFNRSKSGIKYLQYAALGIPCVASPVEPYLPLIANGANGFIAQDNSPEEWYKILDQLVESKAIRTAVGEEARKVMKKKYDVSVVAGHWLSTYNTILKL